MAPTRLILMAAQKVNGRLSSAAVVESGKGGIAVVKLGELPVSTQYIRVLMKESSNTCDEHDSADVRNCVGYAIQSIQAGMVDGSGTFVEASQDAADKAITYCVSSIDPWHSSEDVNVAENISTAASTFSPQRPHQ